MSDYKWWQGKVTCGICGHNQQSRVEIPTWAEHPVIPLECADCGNMACQHDLPTGNEDDDEDLFSC
jgi:hypothetical protein